MKKILIVDDDKMVRDLCSRILASNLYTVESASSPEEALLLLDHTFNLVITDLEMQGFDGLWLVNRIKDSYEDDIPVIIMSGSLYEWQIAQAKDLGASDILLKPFDAGMLISMVSRHIR